MLASTGEEEMLNTETETRSRHNHYNTHIHTLCTSMWEELGVDLLEGFLIYNTTWTLLDREKETREKKSEESMNEVERPTPPTDCRGRHRRGHQIQL